MAFVRKEIQDFSQTPSYPTSDWQRASSERTIWPLRPSAARKMNCPVWRPLGKNGHMRDAQSLQEGPAGCQDSGMENRTALPVTQQLRVQGKQSRGWRGVRQAGSTPCQAPTQAVVTELLRLLTCKMGTPIAPWGRERGANAEPRMGTQRLGPPRCSADTAGSNGGSECDLLGCPKYIRKTGES